MGITPKMPIEMPQGLPFSVDTWTQSSKQKRHHFLTHAHRDHSTGITTHCSFPIYCTYITKAIVLQQFPQLYDSLFVCVEVGQAVVVKDPDGPFTVTVFDAYHCPGAVMFLFEGNFGNILHTGDCRLTPESLQNLPEKYRGKGGKEPKCPLDLIFLDCTFGKFVQQFPSKYSAIRQVINCIWKHPDAPHVYLSSDLLGQEELLQQLYRTFGSKIFVDESMKEGYKVLQLIVPDILSQDPTSRFHLLAGFPKLHQKAKMLLEDAQTNCHHEPLIIRPSTQWYVHEESSEICTTRKQIIHEAIRDKFGIWHVCYSMHSSKEELEWALQVLAPKWVVSTTPGCRAMDLDYVKKQRICFRAAANGLIWKLLGLSEESSLDEDSSMVEVGCSSPVDVTTQMHIEPQLQPVKAYSVSNEILSILSSNYLPPVTLFGRARLAMEDRDSLQRVEVPYPSTKDEPTQAVREKVADLSIHEPNDILRDESLENLDKGVNPDPEQKNEKSTNAAFHSERVRLSVSVEKAVSMNNDPRHIHKQASRLEDESLDDRGKVSRVPEPQSEKIVNDKTTVCSNFHLLGVGSSNGFNDKIKKLYKSMSVSVSEKIIVSTNDEPHCIDEEESRSKGKSLDVCEDFSCVPEPQPEKIVNGTTAVCTSPHLLSVGSSKGFNDKFRKLYRSMNVSVPEPLPSLMDLMKSRKRPKRYTNF